MLNVVIALYDYSPSQKKFSNTGHNPKPHLDGLSLICRGAMYKGKRTVRYDRQAPGIENVHRKYKVTI